MNSATASEIHAFKTYGEKVLNFRMYWSATRNLSRKCSPPHIGNPIDYNPVVADLRHLEGMEIGNGKDNA